MNNSGSGKGEWAMSRVAIVTDSACDLTLEQADQRNVRVVPLTIRFGDHEFVDREDLSTKEFWDRMAIDPTMPETAAPSPGAFKQAFIDEAEAGADGVVCVTLSSKLSATYQAANIAATSVADQIEVHVVDSLSVTVGLGLMVMTAADRASEGRTLEEISSELIGVRGRTRVFAIVESLEFLKRGGRIGGAQALLGSLLSIKPIIELRDGTVEVESKQRTRGRALAYLASKALDAGPLDRLAMASAMTSDAHQLATRLAAADCEDELVVSDIGPVIGAHAGPGTIGVSYQTAR
jgi:DegV family protein with EDD domain